MNPSNSYTAADSTARGQAGHPQAPWAMYTFIPYQPNQHASATPDASQHHLGRPKSGRSGLKFVQYQPPVSSTEITAPTEDNAPQMVNTPKENPCTSTRNVNDSNVPISSMRSHFSPTGTGKNTEDTVHDTSSLESTVEEQGEAVPAQMLSTEAVDIPGTEPVTSAPAAADSTPPETSSSLAKPSVASVVGSTTPSGPTTEIGTSIADDPAPSPPLQTTDTPPAGGSMPLRAVDSPPVERPTPESPFHTTDSDTFTEEYTAPPVPSSQASGTVSVLGTTHPSSSLHVVTPDILSASQSSKLSGTSNGGESDSDDDILDEHSTHQLRNPHHPVIPSGSRPGQKSKNVTAKVAKEIRDAKDKGFDADIEALLSGLATDMKALAVKHSRSEDIVKQLIIQRTNYKNTRKASLFNALVHHIALEVNNNRPPGDRLPLHEIQKLALEAQEKLTKTEKKELLQELNGHRDTMTNGVRCNNIAANQDYQSTVTRMGAELTALTNRTGCVAIAFFAPGHINDTTFPCWVHSSNTEQFVADELKMSAGEFSRRLGLWATSRNNKPKAVNKLVALQKECAKIILEGLHNITGRRDLKMSYEKYISDIQLAHKVQLQGWPWETNLQTPYAINVISDVRLLHDALKAGKCFWVKMTSQEYDDLSHEQQRRAPKTKKKGKGKRKRRGNDENADPSERPSTSQKARKSRKTAAVQQPVRSRSVVSDSEDSD